MYYIHVQFYILYPLDGRVLEPAVRAVGYLLVCTIIYMYNTIYYILYPLNGRVLEPAVRTTGHFGGSVLCTMYSVHMNCTKSSRWVST